MNILIYILVAVLAAVIGIGVTIVINRRMANTRAKQIVTDAERVADELKKSKELEGCEEALKKNRPQRSEFQFFGRVHSLYEGVSGGY